MTQKDPRFMTMGEMVMSRLEDATKLAAAEIQGDGGVEPPAHMPPPGEIVKEAADEHSDELLKIAAQCDYVAIHLPKLAAEGATEASSQIPAETGVNTVQKQVPTTQRGIAVEGGASTDGTPDVSSMESSATPTVNPATAMKTTYTEPPGGGESMGPSGADGVASASLPATMSEGSKQAQVTRVRALLAKIGYEDTSPSSAGPGKGPGALDTNATEGPPIPSEGQPVQDIQEVIDITKRETKAPVKEELKEFVEEPAQKKQTDPVANDMFDTAEQAGVKMSELQAGIARVYLRKVAEAGCTCNGAGSCGYCALSAKYAQEEEGKGEGEEKKDEEAKAEGKEKKDEGEKKKDEEAKAEGEGGQKQAGPQSVRQAIQF